MRKNYSFHGSYIAYAKKIQLSRLVYSVREKIIAFTLRKTKKEIIFLIFFE